MIRISVEFADKETGFLVEDIKLEIPDEIIFRAIEQENEKESRNIEYINALMFDVSDEMKVHIIQEYPETAKKFEKYNYFFIGRQGLGPEYD